jgi:phospholipase/lecithinase/hemolysin
MKTRLLTCLLLPAALVAVNAATAADFSAIYAFGDSYSDNGDAGVMSSSTLSRSILAGATPPKDATQLPAAADSEYMKAGGGRWSNGPTAVEVMAVRLNATLTDFAVGGAKSGEDNYYAWLDSPQKSGVLGQIAKFRSTVPNGADPDALYFIFIGANDYFQAEDNNLFANLPPINDAAKIGAIADGTVANIVTAVRNLGDAGAKHVMVVNSTDLSLVPWENFYERTADAAAFTARVNSTLPGALSALASETGIDVFAFDHTAVSAKIVADPAGHGLSELKQPCRLTWYPDQAKAAATPTCSNPDGHYFWDEWHPTAAVHRIVGEAMAEAVQSRP